MDEYISREETVKAFCEKCQGYYDGHCIHRGECDIDVIQTAPTADVQPVRHGKWLPSDSYITAAYGTIHCQICSECGADLMEDDDYDFDFCPVCGARMDGDAE